MQALLKKDSVMIFYQKEDGCLDSTSVATTHIFSSKDIISKIIELQKKCVVTSVYLLSSLPDDCCGFYRYASLSNISITVTVCGTTLSFPVMCLSDLLEHKCKHLERTMTDER